ncbi:MAG: ribosome maturation factor RimM [Betaproteobacteria bacterium]
MGRVVAAVGIRGEVRIKTFTEEAEGLAGYDRWVVRTPDGWREMALEGFALRPNGTVAKLGGCEDREAAERLRGADIAIPRGEFEAAEEEGQLYQVDLIGLQVVDEQGSALGTVDSFFETGGTSVMVVKGARERMIPFVADYVKSVDREARRIVVDWKADYDA